MIAESYIPAGFHRHSNGGGLIADSAFVAETGYIGPSAHVGDYARVGGNARVMDYAIVGDYARVMGNANVGGNARVMDYAIVGDYARVMGNAIVGGNARVMGNAHVGDYAIVEDYARVTRPVIFLSGLHPKWVITIADSTLRIGCQQHNFARWRTLDDGRIKRMDDAALDFWNAHKFALLALCAHQEALVAAESDTVIAADETEVLR